MWDEVRSVNCGPSFLAAHELLRVPTTPQDQCFSRAIISFARWQARAAGFFCDYFPSAERAARRHFIVVPHVLIPPRNSDPVMRVGLSLLLSIFVLVCHPLLAATRPRAGENAYCEEGDIARFGNKDGPAELPKSCYYTGLDGTPSPGKQVRVTAKADLSAALEEAKCGDTLLLPAGASFEVKELPRKNCDDQHYITIRTDTPDSKLPPEGTRISPAWAGVASLSGRPPFAQPSGGPAKLMAALVVKKPSGVVVGDHTRFIGIEWTSDPNMNIGRLVSAEGADHIIFDRNWIHPAEGAEVGKGIVLNQGPRVIAVINSYISGIACVARSGKCTDASAIGDRHGNTLARTITNVNNYLEGSPVNALFRR